MKTKHFLLAVFIAGLFALSTSDSYACSCPMPEVAEAFDKARAVFIGEVTEIKEPHTDDPKALPADRLYQVRFKVEKSWKGLDFLQEVTILSNQARFVCTWGSFVKGEKYLVYAEETQEKDLAVLFTCNRTASVADASDDLKALKRRGDSNFNFTFDFTYQGNREQ